jgi:predicted small lipoprotein YifL
MTRARATAAMAAALLALAVAACGLKGDPQPPAAEADPPRQTDPAR